MEEVKPVEDVVNQTQEAPKEASPFKSPIKPKTPVKHKSAEKVKSPEKQKSPEKGL